MSQVQLTSSDKTVGSSKSSNTLRLEFTPSKTLSRTGSGRIDIGLPYWYLIQGTGQYSYNPGAEDKCSSDCMSITNSALNIGTLEIKYEFMLDECLEGKAVVIECRGFYNPIVPIVKGGFSVTTYDSNAAMKPIETT